MWQWIKQWIVLGYLVLFSGLGLAWGEEMVAPQQNPARITDTVPVPVVEQIIANGGEPITDEQRVAVQAMALQVGADVPPGGNPPPVPIPIFPPVPPVPAGEQADSIAAPASAASEEDPPIIIDIDPPPGTTTVQLEEVKDPVTGEVIAIKVTYYDVDGVPILPPLAPDPVPMVSPPPPDATVINAGPNGEPYYFDDDGNLLPCPPAGGDDCLPEDDSAGMLP